MDKDEVKGRAKQAAGDVTGNDRLRREGKADETGGKVKDAVGKAKSKVDDAVDSVKNKISN